MGHPKRTARASASEVRIYLHRVMLAYAKKFGIEDTFLEVAYDDLLEINVECIHEILHQVVSERPAGVHLFKSHRDGLGFKTAYNYREPA